MTSAHIQIVDGDQGTGAVAVDIEDGKVSLNGRCLLAAGGVDELIEALRRARWKAYGLPQPSAVTMAIVEVGRDAIGDGPDSLIMPNTVLINGQPVYTAGGIRIHESEIETKKELAQVTVTLPVRLLTVGAEGDLPR